MRKFLWVTGLFFGIFSHGWALELNSATAAQLRQLKGIGVKTAEAIVVERQRAGHFVSPQDLSIRIKGMGKKKVERLLQQGMVVNGQSSFISPATESVKTVLTSDKNSTLADKPSEHTKTAEGVYVRPKQQKK